jgi:alpha-beta hydrolase superfamily lysophospholipase
MGTNQDSPVLTNRRRIIRNLAMAGGAIFTLLVLALIPARPLPLVPSDHPTPPPERFDDFVSEQIKKSRAQGVRAGNEEKFVRRYEKPSPLAILYIHGFGASRAEGEGVVDHLAAVFGAHVYYLRLPGHGGDKDAHLAARPEEYFACVEEAFHRFRPLGQKLVLMGSSAGGLLSIWLASRHPKEVDGVVIANPFFDFADPSAFMISRRIGMPIIEAIYGQERDAGWISDPEKRRVDGYEDHWITKQHFRALHTIDDLRRTIATPEVVRAVEAPILMFYYYADEKHQDTAASVTAMHKFFAQAGGNKRHPLSREVAIADGNHILFSDYVRTDKDSVKRESINFLQAILGPDQ